MLRQVAVAALGSEREGGRVQPQFTRAETPVVRLSVRPEE